jgi:hypothetical protein
MSLDRFAGHDRPDLSIACGGQGKQSDNQR